MKSYFLEGISSIEAGAASLNTLLSGQVNPWLLMASNGETVAYFYLTAIGEPELETPAITVEVSGRYFNADSDVIGVLQQLQSSLGGRISNNN